MPELGDAARIGGEGEAAVWGGDPEDAVDSRRWPASPCCSISVQIPTISVIMLRIASAVLLSPAAVAGNGSGVGVGSGTGTGTGTGTGSEKKLPL